MCDKLVTPESIAQTLSVIQNDIPFAIWETLYVTVLSTLLAVVIGLPLGVLLVAGDANGVKPLPRPIMSVLNVVINLLRSIPFLILMIMVFPNGADELVSDPSREPRIRVVFNGADAAGRPLIASMAVEKGILANIVAASTRGLDGKVYGSMLLGIPGGPEQVREAIDYLQSVSNVIVEEA